MSCSEVRKFRRKLQRARESGKLQDISECCCNLAAYLSEEDEHEEALKLYKESLSCCEKLANKEGVALANRMIAQECNNLGYFDEALKHVILYLKYAKDEGNKVEEQRGLVLKGLVFFTEAEYLADTKPKEAKKIERLLQQSLEEYRKSYEICNSEFVDINEKERMQMKARLLQNKSLVYCRLNKLESAHIHLTRAIKICAAERLNETQYLCFLSLGEVYIKKNEPKNAVAIYNKAFELAHSTQKKRDALIGKARAYIFLEDFQQAKAELKKAYKLRTDDELENLIKHVAAVIRLKNSISSTPDTELKVKKDLYRKLGDAYCFLKSYKKGVEHYLSMLRFAREAGVSNNELITYYNKMCKALTNDKQYDKALFYSHHQIQFYSKWTQNKVFKVYYRIAKLHELNNADFQEIRLAYITAKGKEKNYKFQIKCLKKLISVCQNFNKPDLAKDYEKELNDIKNENDPVSSCESGKDSESEASSDYENNSNCSEIDVRDLISDSDVENEEFDRPKERCKRTKFTIKRNEKGETDLHVAAIKGNYKRVKQLLEQGHPVDVRDTAGWSVLHEACNHGHIDIVNILLDYKADINDRGGPSCEGTTPLHDAATNGQFAVIETLLKRGASTLVLNESGETPLQCLLHWHRTTALDEEEEAIFNKIVHSLKSPLDTEEIKRHLGPNKSCMEKRAIKDNPKQGTSVLKDKSPKQETSVSKDKKRKHETSSVVADYKETINRLRGKRKSNDIDSDGSQPGKSDQDCLPLKRSMKSPMEEYKEAIRNLRYRPRRILNESSKAQRKPALIREEEYVENFIVDNDEEEEEVPEDDNETPGDVNETLEDVEEIRIDLNEDYVQPCKKMKSSPDEKRKPPLEEEIKKKPWLKSIPLDILEDSFELPGTSNDGLKSNSESETCTPTPTVDIIVKTLNDKIKISVNESEISKLDINWLIKEICKKDLEMSNPDNFVFIKVNNEEIGESEFLDLIVGKEVDCVVTKWKILPSSKRYEKVCTVEFHPDVSPEIRTLGFKHVFDPQIAEVLKNSNKTRILNLSNLKLSSLNLIPICKTIKYESFIQNLNLSNNYFGDKGIELILKIFDKCIIEELDISGCNITSSGVYYLSNALKKMNELSKNGLEVLKLDHNPITDDAVKPLQDIIQELPNLRVLNIDYCELKTSVQTNNFNLVIIQGNEFERLIQKSGSDS